MYAIEISKIRPETTKKILIRCQTLCLCDDCTYSLEFLGVDKLTKVCLWICCATKEMISFEINDNIYCVTDQSVNTVEDKKKLLN
jgi:hypothetical protein